MLKTTDYPIEHVCLKNFEDKDLPENEGKLLFMAPFLPLLQARVYVKMNGLGWAWVRAYGISWIKEHYAWISLIVDFENPPDWYVKQNGKGHLGMVTGAEVDWNITAGGEYPIVSKS